ncbi:MAG: TauD/TfdA family dioxygenase [Myxococcales bacterium]|nr:TauD/TfdA family dioxygenase [Myxococcales bacterium]
MTIAAGDIYDALVRDGYYKSPEPVPLEEFDQTMAALAEQLDPIDIRLRLKHPNLGGVQALEAHNECNHFADGLAWYWKDDGGAGDRLFISPMAPIEASLGDAELEHLAHARVSLMRLRVPHTTLARRERGRPILFCPLGPCAFDAQVPGREEAITRFYKRVREVTASARATSPTLEMRSGDFLLLDDRRWVHGRDALPEESSRVLRRTYLVMREREHWLRRTVSQRPFGAMRPLAAEEA